LIHYGRRATYRSAEKMDCRRSLRPGAVTCRRARAARQLGLDLLSNNLSVGAKLLARWAIIRAIDAATTRALRSKIPRVCRPPSRTNVRLAVIAASTGSHGRQRRARPCCSGRRAWRQPWSHHRQAWSHHCHPAATFGAQMEPPSSKPRWSTCCNAACRIQTRYVWRSNAAASGVSRRRPSLSICRRTSNPRRSRPASSARRL
jgi:hypothetical protein